MDTRAKLELAHHVARALEQIPGVAAVALGGSLARGRAQPNSDIDLGIYYHAAHAPNVQAFREAACTLGDANAGETVTDYGGWGAWVNGGAWLELEGQRVDWIYRDLGRVAEVIERCQRGRPERQVHGGHPHGFHSHIYLGEVFYSQTLSDPAGELARLKERVRVYPARLKEALIKTYLWEAEFALLISEKPISRGESSYVAGCFFECVYSLVQVLFALNERLFVNEKGAVEETGTLGRCPAGFADEVSSVMGSIGNTPEVLERSRRRLHVLLTQVAALTEV
jgi:hypothetical protein